MISTPRTIFFRLVFCKNLLCEVHPFSYIFVLCVYYFLPVYFKLFLKIRLLALSYTSASVAFYP